MLKPQDLVVLLKLVVAEPGTAFWRIASELQLSPSAVHRSLERAAHAGLYQPATKTADLRALHEFLAHGAKYVFPPVQQGEARGMATAWAAQPLSDRLSASGKAVPVWPYALGDSRGVALMPIHKVVPKAAAHDSQLRELLALFDAIRIGAPREREMAIEILSERLNAKAAPP
jgi:hypothetical protein